MRRLFTSLCLSFLLSSCVGPFAGKGTSPSGPLSLGVVFDSTTASAQLRWERARVKGFLYYRIERARNAGFDEISTVRAQRDTSYADRGLLASTAYRYRVTAVFGRDGEDQPQALESTTVEGGFHRLLNSWVLPVGFLPTRLVFDETAGVLNVVGAGAGWVQRFDRGGNSMGRWHFSSSPNACLETGTLDGPTLALDADGNLYVVYNQLDPGAAPRALWTKFDPRGEAVWTRPLRTAFARHIAIDGNEIFVESISQLQQFDPMGERVADYPIPALLVSSLRFWKGRFAALVEPLNFGDIGWQAPRLVVYSSADRSETDLVMGRDPLSEEDRGAGLLKRPSDFVVDERTNRVFVVNAGHDRIEVFKDSIYLTRWTEKENDETRFSFTGTLSVIDDLSAGTTRVRAVRAGGISRDEEGYLYVADTFNNRIQKFQP